ncbi:uncharacterized protein RJT20DRAFT_37257 [Scheffersomyces xylosifermentans]|uniref:uncharacterized protein n=1 Tax=Scheffersomyces xylosifermentans TaxID=1304137 RepID=UPI00315CFE81
MSAYILLAATSEVKRLEETNQIKKKKKNRTRDKNGNRDKYLESITMNERKVKELRKIESSADQLRRKNKHVEGISSSDSLRRRYSDASSSSSGSTRKVFNINTNTYIDRELMRSPLEKKISEWEKQYMKFKRESRFHETNDSITTYSVDGIRLFSKRNVRVLRYTYFEDFTSDYDLIDYRMKTNRPRLRFMEKILKLNKITEGGGKSGLPSFMKEDTLDEKGDNESAMISDDNSSVDERELSEWLSQLRTAEDDSSSGLSTSLEGLYQDFTRFQQPTKKTTVRKLLSSNQFWNNVYQDLKFDSIHMKSSIDCFDMMPSVSQVMHFYKELVDYFLYNLKLLTVTGEGDKYNFFYFNDFNHDYFTLMNKVHSRMYKQQSHWNSSLNNVQHPLNRLHSHQSHLSYQSHQSHHSISSSTSREKIEDRVDAHRTLINRLIDAIIDNLKFSTTDSRANDPSSSRLFELWRNFLQFLFLELLVHQEEDVEEEKLPEPDPDIVNCDFDEPAPSEVCIVGLPPTKRNESISSKSSRGGSSIMSSPQARAKTDSVISSGSGTDMHTPPSFEEHIFKQLPVLGNVPQAIDLHKVHSYIPYPKTKKKRSLFGFKNTA